jgi:hypothetical protein
VVAAGVLLLALLLGITAGVLVRVAESDIRADLQRIGILAGSILAVLLALRILVFR